MIRDLFHPEIPTVLHVRVRPKASKNDIKVDHQSDGTRMIRVYVTVAAEDGKANDAVLTLIAKDLGIAKERLWIARGHKTRDKIIHIATL